MWYHKLETAKRLGLSGGSQDLYHAPTNFRKLAYGFRPSNLNESSLIQTVL